MSTYTAAAIPHNICHSKQTKQTSLNAPAVADDAVALHLPKAQPSIPRTTLNRLTGQDLGGASVVGGLFLFVCFFKMKGLLRRVCARDRGGGEKTRREKGRQSVCGG